jgi:signal transduction histidine kinase
MSETKPMSRREEWLEFWERREAPFLRVLPYVLLLLCAAFDVAARSGLGAGAYADLGLAAIAGLVLAAVDRVDRRASWTEPTHLGPVVATTVFAVLLGLSATLVIRQPIYGFYTWTGYFWAWRLFRGNARLLGVALVAMVTAISQTGSGPYDSVYTIGGLVVVYLINASVATALTWFGWIGTEQQERRAREVSALTEANAKLEASLRQNAELQEQLLTQARQAGVSAERGRMAREIHDTLAQGLMGILTQLQAAQGAGTGIADDVAARHVDQAIGLARESLTEARRSVQALAPEPLVGARLPDAIQDVSRRWSDLHGLQVSFTTTGTPRVMRPEIEVALLRTAQEALANVAKHADATRVGLTLSYMEDLITLDVRDDGVGFVTVNGSGPRRPRHSQGGFGLRGMRQRVEGVAGTLAIESEPDGGTAISAAIPAVLLGEGS